MAAALAAFKTMIVWKNMTSLKVKLFVYPITALWECSNAVLIIGGVNLQERYCISTYQRAWAAALCRCQVTFQEEKRDAWTRWAMGSFELVAWLVGVAVLWELFHYFQEYISDVPILEAEALIVFLSSVALAVDLPSQTWELFMILTTPYSTTVQVILPFDPSIYFSDSLQAFWRKWSRPAGQFLRHLFYYPSGGSYRIWLSVPAMFLLNAISHYHVSLVLVGKSSMMGWNIVFGITGVTTLLEMAVDRFMERTYAADSEWQPFAYRLLRGIVAHIAIRVVAYVMVHQCFHSSIAAFL